MARAPEDDSQARYFVDAYEHLKLEMDRLKKHFERRLLSAACATLHSDSVQRLIAPGAKWRDALSEPGVRSR